MNKILVDKVFTNTSGHQIQVTQEWTSVFFTSVNWDIIFNNGKKELERKTNNWIDYIMLKDLDKKYNLWIKFND